MTSEEFRSKLRESTSKAGDTRGFNDKQWREFENRLHYFAGDINDEQFYGQLRDQIEKMQAPDPAPTGCSMFPLPRPWRRP